MDPTAVASSSDAGAEPGAQPLTLGYIGGTSFCGSTLVSFLLNAQPNVVSVGEVAWRIPEQQPGEYPCSCGATLDTCLFWREVARAMKERGYDFGPSNWDANFFFTDNALVRRLACQSLGSNLADRIRDSLVSATPGWGPKLAEVGKRNNALFASIAALTGASTFVDATKDHNRVRFLRRYSGIEPRVVHLVRDSPAFVYSCLKHGHTLDEAIAWWNRTAWNMQRLRATTPADRWLLVRHEDVCADPAGEINRMLRFLGVRVAVPVLDFRSTPHHIIGNRWRLGGTSEIRLDSSWREGLTKEQMDRVRARTVTYRRLLGYQPH